jgi:hypothetical protein
MKSALFTSVLLFSALSSAGAASRNLCDDLIESGNSTPEQIKRCQEKFGVSDYAKEQEAKNKLKEDSNKIKNDNEAKQKENIEIKKFVADDLYDAGFGKPFIAIKIDYRVRPPKEKRITEGNALCTYLGYERSIKSVVSGEIMPQDIDKKGLIIDTSIFGNISNEPEMYKDDDLKFTARKYVEITCVRRKDKSMDSFNEVYKKLSEDLVVLANEINGGKPDTTSGINNGPRGGKDTKTPNGYNAPEWMKEGDKTISK